MLVLDEPSDDTDLVLASLRSKGYLPHLIRRFRPPDHPLRPRQFRRTSHRLPSSLGYRS